ncbi:MAG: hypothetical protein PHT92_11275, partial [Bacteroidales bacterium]|nr:hypothetical protein [Bacteroidales bacterium]
VAMPEGSILEDIPITSPHIFYLSRRLSKNLHHLESHKPFAVWRRVFLYVNIFLKLIRMEFGLIIVKMAVDQSPFDKY